MFNKKFKVENNITAVYCFWIDEKRVYIGKTKNLRQRLVTHTQTIKQEEIEWKTKINRITYFLSNNFTDIDILETYLINEYNPQFNICKKYNIKSTFNINIPLELDVLLENKKVILPNNPKLYLNKLKTNEITINELPIEFEYIKKAYDILGLTGFKKCNFRWCNITNCLIIYNHKEDILQEILNSFEINTFYKLSDIKLKLGCIYEKYISKKSNIYLKNIQPKTITKLFLYKRKRKTLDKKLWEGYFILSVLQTNSTVII